MINGFRLVNSGNFLASWHQLSVQKFFFQAYNFFYKVALVVVTLYFKHQYYIKKTKHYETI